MKSTKGHEMSPSLSKPLSNLHHKFVFNGFNLFMLHLYVRGTSSKMSENTETPLQSLVVYELNQKVIGHIGVKQLEQTFFSVKAKESIFFFRNRNPVTVCISVWRSS